jgi:hypothetical protein
MKHTYFDFNDLYEDLMEHQQNLIQEKTATIDKKNRGKVAAGLKKVAGMLRVSADEESDDKKLSADLLKAYKEVSDAAGQAKSGKITLTTQVTDALEQAKVYNLVIKESILAEATDAKAVIKSLVDTSFGGDNESQMKAVQLLKGLATSDDPAANAFMKKLDAFTSKMSAGDGEKVEESMKSDLDKLDLGPDEFKKSGKKITMIWKTASGISAEEITKRLKSGLAKHADLIKFMGAKKEGEGIVAHIDMK